MRGIKGRRVRYNGKIWTVEYRVWGRHSLWRLLRNVRGRLVSTIAARDEMKFVRKVYA